MRKNVVGLLVAGLLFLPTQSFPLTLAQVGVSVYDVLMAALEYGSSRYPFLLASVGGIPLLFYFSEQIFSYISNWIDNWNRHLPRPGDVCFAPCPPPFDTSKMCRYRLGFDCFLRLDAVYVWGSPMCGDKSSVEYGCRVPYRKINSREVSSQVVVAPVSGEVEPPPGQVSIPDISVSDPTAFSTAVQIAMADPQTAEVIDSYEEALSGDSDTSFDSSSAGASFSGTSVSVSSSSGGVSVGTSGTVSVSLSDVAGETVGGDVSISGTVSMGNLSAGYSEGVSGAFDTQVHVPEMTPLNPEIPNIPFSVEMVAPTCRVGGVEIFGKEITFDFCPWEQYIDLLGNLLIWFLRGFALFILLRL